MYCATYGNTIHTALRFEAALLSVSPFLLASSLILSFSSFSLFFFLSFLLFPSFSFPSSLLSSSFSLTTLLSLLLCSLSFFHCSACLPPYYFLCSRPPLVDPVLQWDLVALEILLLAILHAILITSLSLLDRRFYMADGPRSSRAFTR